jgi:hypothetical protein
MEGMDGPRRQFFVIDYHSKYLNPSRSLLRTKFSTKTRQWFGYLDLNYEWI